MLRAVGTGHGRTIHPAKASASCSTPLLRRVIRCHARQRRPDYASRRSGGDEENVRRASRAGGSSRPSTATPNSESWGWRTDQQTDKDSPSANGSAPVDPRVKHRRSASYASRRTGSDPENQRRRSASSSSSFYSDSDSVRSANPSHSANGGPHIDHQVQRDRSTDYTARRIGSNGDGTQRHSPNQSQSPTLQPDAAAASTSSTPHIDPRVQRRRSVDYGARRSGAHAETGRRRGSTNRVARSTRSSSPSSPSPAMDPRVRRRRSVDYASRRSSTDSASDPHRSPLPTDSRSPASSTPHIDMRAQSRKSVDYASRRGGADSGSTRRRSHTSRTPPPRRAASAPSPRQSTPHVDPRVQRRRSIDYSARRGGQDADVSRRFVSPFAEQQSARPSGPYVHRKSGDHASRRSSGEEENSRRRSDDARAAREPMASSSRTLPPRRQSVDRRKSSPDYASRRGGEVTRRRPSTYSRTPPTRQNTSWDSTSGSNGAGPEERRKSRPYIARKAIPSYESRRSRDFAQRRRSMRFTLKEVRSALEAHNRRSGTSNVGGRSVPVGNRSGSNGSVLDIAFVDYGVHAMRSVEGLLDTFCELSGVPADKLKRSRTPNGASRQGGDADPAKGALRSLSAMADLIERAATTSK